MNSLKPLKFIIHTIGCKTNQAESDAIAGHLIKRGFVQADMTAIADNVDYIIINTCTVTSAADRKVRHLIRKLKSASPKSELLVTGCFAQINEELLKEIAADYVFSNTRKNEIADFVCTQALKKEAQGTLKNPGYSAKLQNNDPAIVDSLLEHSHSRALVKIQDGCEQGCAYCIVPKVRGPYSSTDPAMILKDISSLVLLGHDEIVLTGIHIGKFGIDLLPKKDVIKTLPELAVEILKKTGVKRLRFSSIEINEIDQSLIDIIRNYRPAVAPHLHIPLQSGSDDVLKSMGRKYDSSFFIDSVEHIKNAIPDITLTTDIIVGFPGETRKDFEETVGLVKKIGFCRVHVFKYSKRPATRAADMEGQVQEIIKTERSSILRKLGSDLRNNFISSNTGRMLDVVCEEFDNKKNVACGTSENYVRVYFDLSLEKFKMKKGRILKVHTKSAYSDGLCGEVIGTDKNLGLESPA